MKAANPAIKVGAVVIVGEDAFPTAYTVTNPRTGASHTGWTPVLFNALKSGGVLPDFVVYH